MDSLLAAQPFLAGLNAQQLGRLACWAKPVEFPAGYRLFDEDGHADRFWILLDGRVSLDTEIPGRGTVIIETLGPGSVVGWSWLFPPHRWHFGATVTEPTSTIELDGPGVQRVCEEYPAFGYQIAQRILTVVVQRLQATRVRLLDLYGSPS